MCFRKETLFFFPLLEERLVIRFICIHSNVSSIRQQDLLNFDGLRQASQCVGRVIRSKIDYGLMIFADSRYNRYDKRSKLPKWILNFLGDAQLNLSTDTAIAQVKQFLRVMAQPVDQNALKQVLLTLQEVQMMSPPMNSSLVEEIHN